MMQRMGFSLVIFSRLGFSLLSRGPETMRRSGLLVSPLIPPGGRTPKEERKEETGGEERAPTAVAPMKVSSPN
jgi:hypothetical protein